ncbi:MAG: cell division ATP-binding protein FtsE [Candidatus Brennerbacteria bacterium RIFOXYC1_FULL_41_11]|uniref:Cell division ATP-binding protein FtsE n=1 Tax=Candidatus Brennerbacteria bacterium RIFOXYD1_FULL_41_16 TaxID=1797529 RepID=A0A1G1XM23_9BACT|nr:MAG: cell division ATP-binding protein FtsE [Candidatus Brennerbacteria bacterium RIFOXYB1_FULL_41_13]OGY39117.1 MAG: cell division ATP-binding protein FtsE [Candidatus Brennerbacteria bacterium RIFOXYC1_FULL_41_11]OGY40377.1 MAG: cell division ATP-binding protein FtsE [Candidatus Brennerbacteria bacterium RIFOXYD1_FULL_41_16]
MISFENVSKIYPNRSIALDSVSFDIEKGEFISLAGKSGAGKSTILKLLIAEEKPTKGRVVFSGIELNKISTREMPILRRRIGMVFQDYKLLTGKTAHENVAYAMEVAGMPDSDIKRDVAQVLELVGLSDRRNNFPTALSGGEKQRVAIARALVQRPEVMVADEPTGNLDPINTWEIIKLLMKINELGTTVILATHDKEIVDTLERRVIILDKGRVIKDEEKGKYIIT